MKSVVSAISAISQLYKRIAMLKLVGGDSASGTHWAIRSKLEQHLWIRSIEQTQRLVDTEVYMTLRQRCVPGQLRDQINES